MIPETGMGVLDWFLADPINRYLSLMFLLISAGIGAMLLRSLRTADGQCGHPTQRGGLCRRPLAPGKLHCGFPNHRQDWRHRALAGCLASALVGISMLAFTPLPHLNLGPTQNPTPGPPTRMALPSTPATPAAQQSPRSAPAIAAPSITTPGSTEESASPKTPSTTRDVAVPNLMGLPIGEARSVLNGVDLDAVQTTAIVTNPTQDGIIVRQYPPAGQMKGRGQRVELVVGVYIAPTPQAGRTIRATSAPEPPAAPATTAPAAQPSRPETSSSRADPTAPAPASSAPEPSSSPR